MRISLKMNALIALMCVPAVPTSAQFRAGTGTPQPFEVASGEVTGFGFAVSQPGPITIRAQ